MSEAPGWATLADGESVVWTGRPVIYHFLDGLLVAAVLLAIAAAAYLFWPAGVGGIPAIAPAGVLAGIAVFWAFGTLLERWRITYLVTSHQVYVKRGLVSRTVKNLHVDQIQNTSFRESLLGRLFSYGHVRIDTAGSDGAEMVLKNVANPDEVLGLISRDTERS